MRSFVVCVLTALLLTGCTSRVGGAPETGGTGPSTPGPVDLAVPIELRPVLAAGATDPAAVVLPTDDGERLTLSEPILTIRRLERAEVELVQTTWVLNLVMDDADGRTFGDWTAAHIGERLALVADERVLTAPQIQDAITGGEIQIAARYTQEEAQALLDEITGR